MRFSSFSLWFSTNEVFRLDFEDLTLVDDFDGSACFLTVIVFSLGLKVRN